MTGKLSKYFEVVVGVGSPLFSILGLIGLLVMLQYPYRLDYGKAVTFGKVSILTLSALVFGIIFSLVAIGGCLREARMTIKAGLWGCLLLSSVCAAILFFDSQLGIHSAVTAENICINDARQIEAAKADWAQKHGATNGMKVTWNDLTTYFTNGIPKCPKGGSYELGRVGGPVTCSNPKHRIQSE